MRLPPPGRLIPSPGLGPGSGPIFMTGAMCRGNELNVEKCIRTEVWGQAAEDTCNPTDVVAIECGFQPPASEHRGGTGMGMVHNAVWMGCVTRVAG